MEEKYETVQIDISDDVFLAIAKEAQKLNITFDQMVERILLEEIEKEQKDEN